MSFLNCSRILTKNLYSKFKVPNVPIQNQKFYNYESKRNSVKLIRSSIILSARYSASNSANNKKIKTRGRSTQYETYTPNTFRTSLSTVPDYCPHVPIIATNSDIIFPKFSKTIEVTDPILINTIRQKISLNQPYAGVFLKKNLNDKAGVVNSIEDVYSIGSFVHIKIVEDMGEKLKLTVNSIRRIKITNQFLLDNVNGNGSQALFMAEIVNINQDKFKLTNEIKALAQEVVKTIREIILKNPLLAEVLERLLYQNHIANKDAVYLADLAASLTSAQPIELQQIMEEPAIRDRLMLSLSLLKQELELSKLQEKLRTEIEDKIKTIHRKFILTEQIKILQKELGVDVDDKDTITQRFMDKIKDRAVPDMALNTINDEIKKLKLIEGYGSDFNVIRNYLDWLTSMPWGYVTKENTNIKQAGEILDANHFGMTDIKTRILEFIAVSTLKGSTQGKILCFYGPPGVGKTSVARSIAESLNRRYYRFSMGGMSNVAEIKGHRRTYVGAMPGKIIQCLKATQSENPLVLIDEIDKIGKSLEQSSGDPSSALLELLDPEQNVAYMDHYLDVPVDLSKILFICTANTIDRIPSPLLDRMEIIDMAGYIDEEKLAIAKQYLIPRALKESGLTNNNIEFEEESLVCLMKGYCRESGVRSLQKQIEKIIRKIALKVVQNDKRKVILSKYNLCDYLGRPVFTSDRLYKETPPGVAMGLGYTKFGGTVLYIETSTEETKKSISNQKVGLYLTGNLGLIMKESAEIALTVAKNYLHKSEMKDQFFETNKIHLHVPKASQPKDGPSAGITIVAALVSLALNKPARQNVAMTGEVTLNGNILPVGGIKEKIIAAKRTGINCVILPEENRSDYDELPNYITDGLEVHFVSHYLQAAKIIFEN